MTRITVGGETVDTDEINQELVDELIYHKTWHKRYEFGMWLIAAVSVISFLIDLIGE